MSAGGMGGPSAGPAGRVMRVGSVAGYPASAFRSPASIFSAASSCMPGITCEYVSRVMPLEA